jgi:uncharacterized protein
MILALMMALCTTDTPYISQNVHYYNADSSIHFGGTFTKPADNKPHTTLILVSGTGRQDRNGTMAGHKMFLTIADYLTRNGYSVLRVDDRGTGETTGKYEDATTQDFATDILTGITYLKTRKDVKNIGLIGHSEGGAAAYIAASQSSDVKYVISLAGLATTGLKALKQQNEAIISSAGIAAQTAERYNSVNTFMFDSVYAHAQSPDLEQHIRNAYAAWKITDDEKMAREGSKDPSKGHFFFPLESYIMQATGPWYRYHIRFDPAPYLQKLTIPVLAINGDKDIMVNSRENLGNYKRYVKNITTWEAPGLNHLFQHCVTCTMQEPSTLKEDFAPEVLEKIKDWLKQTI